MSFRRRRETMMRIIVASRARRGTKSTSVFKKNVEPTSLFFYFFVVRSVLRDAASCAKIFTGPSSKLFSMELGHGKESCEEKGCEEDREEGCEEEVVARSHSAPAKAGRTRTEDARESVLGFFVPTRLATFPGAPRRIIGVSTSPQRSLNSSYEDAAACSGQCRRCGDPATSSGTTGR